MSSGSLVPIVNHLHESWTMYDSYDSFESHLRVETFYLAEDETWWSWITRGPLEVSEYNAFWLAFQFCGKLEKKESLTSDSTHTDSGLFPPKVSAFVSGPHRSHGPLAAFWKVNFIHRNEKFLVSATAALKVEADWVNIPVWDVSTFFQWASEVCTPNKGLNSDNPITVHKKIFKMKNLQKTFKSNNGARLQRWCIFLYTAHLASSVCTGRDLSDKRCVLMGWVPYDAVPL